MTASKPIGSPDARLTLRPLLDGDAVLRGVVPDGRIAVGRAYGYRPTAEHGRFEIVAEEAEIVRRIMCEYAAGISRRAIAKALNAEGVPGPRGGT